MSFEAMPEDFVEKHRRRRVRKATRAVKRFGDGSIAQSLQIGGHLLHAVAVISDVGRQMVRDSPPGNVSTRISSMPSVARVSASIATRTTALGVTT